MESAGDMERLELRTQATPAAVPGIRRAVVDFAELHGGGVGPAVDRERPERPPQATPGAVRGIRRAVVAFAELHGVGVGPDVALAVSEAITNAVLHAYRQEQA